MNAVRMELVKKTITTSLLLASAVYLLYKSWLLSALLCLMTAIFSYRNKSSRDSIIRSKRQAEFSLFLEMFASFAIVPGNFLRIFSKSLQEFNKMNPKGILYDSIQKTINKAASNLSTQNILSDFAKQIDLEEAYMFCESITICEQTGGNMNSTIKDAILFINERAAVEADIRLVTAAKNAERIIVSASPFVVLALFNLIDSGYLELLYTSFQGRLVMSAAAALFFLSSFAAKKILEVDV